MNIRAKNIVAHGFLFCVAGLPLISLFWQTSIPGLDIKVNWLLYPLFLACVAFYVLMRNRVPRQVIYLLMFTCFYLTIILIRGRDGEGLFRFVFSLAPFAFLEFFHEERDRRTLTVFWIIYLIAFLRPMYFAYLQYTGRMPYYDFDMVDGNYVGRISAGYSKPNNFVAYLFPIFLLGFYFLLVKKRQILGSLTIAGVCGLLLIIGHRTSLLAFLMIVAGLLFMRLFTRTIYNYYKYCLNIVAGISAFVIIYVFQALFGLVDIFRGRLVMWEAHAENFFSSSALEILFGKQQILMDGKYASSKLVGSLQEAHNNTFRTIVFFGIVGYVLYCLFVRWIVLSTYKRNDPVQIQFIKFACFAFLIFYSVTNEPYYYSGILWPALAWVLLLGRPRERLLEKN